MEIREGVPLGPLTTLGLGGPARWLAEIGDEVELGEALAWAVSRRAVLHVLGGGSNLVVADGGVDGLVLRVGLTGVRAESRGGEVLATAAAGETWDSFVARCVEEGWQGVECLSGIPGTVGGTPIQNVGAYGQEVAAVIRRVRVMDLASGAVRELAAGECGFGYRSSAFRALPGQLAVLAVTFALRPGGAPEVRYPELRRALDARRAAPSLAEVRETVLELRRGKSMVLSAEDPASRSVGSFFVNPVVSRDEAERLAAAAVVAGVVATPGEVPAHPAPDGKVKLSAAWLIERAGFPRGTRRGAVGISPRHALALVHHGGGSAAALVALARDIRAAVRARFAVDLQPEPVFWGFASGDPTA
ncbi:MAG TPA: UDP-N-acetylmuramate dehydrogenase [Thermoanaerobaculaceae bacterium]|nr:UDP-N-acetylmuramate dehydrogenase [Thermoanaerobaculaceae bacterium]HRS14982.1 UDP-N-acetylmuramate dehydrogenase [Thermoanaerobaculaceae bacterium]